MYTILDPQHPYIFRGFFKGKVTTWFQKVAETFYFFPWVLGGGSWKKTWGKKNSRWAKLNNKNTLRIWHEPWVILIGSWWHPYSHSLGHPKAINWMVCPKKTVVLVVIYYENMSGRRFFYMAVFDFQGGLIQSLYPWVGFLASPYIQQHVSRSYK